MIDDNPRPMILAELDDNNMLALDDGSIWGVAPGSAPKASTWYPSSRVTVRLVNEGSHYPYAITRIMDGDSIMVRKIN